MATLAEYVRGRRETLGLTQGEVEARFGIPQAYLSAIERGRTRRPSPEFRARLAQALKVSAVDLVVAAEGLTPEELDDWARRSGFRRSGGDDWPERLVRDLVQEGESSPRVRLARRIPWLARTEAEFLLAIVDQLPTEARRKREVLREKPVEFREWRDVHDALEVVLPANPTAPRRRPRPAR